MLQVDKESRQLLKTSLETAEHLHISSRFQKDHEKKFTGADWQATGPPYVPTCYAEVDMVIANKKAQHIIKNVESNIDAVLPC